MTAGAARGGGLTELAEAMDVVAGQLSQGTRFDQLWSEHLRQDAAQMRLLSQSERHLAQDGATTERVQYGHLNTQGAAALATPDPAVTRRLALDTRE